MDKYADLLKDPLWQKKRLQIMERDIWKCQNCGDKDHMLSVHHKFYTHGVLPWAYPDTNYVTLCNKCHLSEHEYKDFLNGLIGDFLLMGHSYKSLYTILDENSRIIIDAIDQPDG